MEEKAKLLLELNAKHISELNFNEALFLLVDTQERINVRMGTLEDYVKAIKRRAELVKTMAIIVNAHEY